jgi:hypothetical protein
MTLNIRPETLHDSLHLSRLPPKLNHFNCTSEPSPPPLLHLRTFRARDSLQYVD